MSRKSPVPDHRMLVWSAVYGIALAAAIVVGHRMEHTEYLTFSFFFIACIAVLGALITAAVFLLFRKLHETWDRSPTPVSGSDAEDFFTRDAKPYFLKVWAGLVLCQVPVFLGVFPGFFVYDASDEMYQIVTRNFSTHHPLVHVLTMGGTVQGVFKLTGSYNAGIALYIGLQAILICAAFALVLTMLRQWGVARTWRIAAFLFLGVFPPVVMFTLCSAKDGIFSAAFLVFEALLIRLWERKDAFFACRKRCLFFFFVTLVMLLYRNNAVYAYLVFLPFGILFLPGAKQQDKARTSGWGMDRKKLAGLLVLPLVCAILVNTSLAAATRAEGTHHQEKLTVPIQQLARLYNHAPESFSEAERATLLRYLPEEHLNLYRPRLADPVKVGFDNAAYEADRASFRKLWLAKGASHPAAYLNAWLMTSYGYWYPFAVINVYEGNEVFTFTYDKSSYFGYEVEQPGTRHSFIPAIDALYRTLSIGRAQQEIPVVSLLFAPSAYFWLLALAACFLLTGSRTNERRRAVLMLPLFLYWLTLLLGPTYLLRYVVILLETTVLLPVLLRSHDGHSKA